jgi:predicted HD superfamily hydrolase involved in NAD metabolism
VSQKPSILPYPILAPYLGNFQFDGDIRSGMTALLAANNLPRTAGHCARVADEAARIARQYSLDAQSAAIGGWLHDISAIVTESQRIQVAGELGLELLPSERAAPMIIHQKLSAVIAGLIFGVSDPAVLSAIGCHTTLKAGASPLDLALFVADKIAWDQPGQPPWLKEIQAALEQSLDHAAFCYTSYLWERRDSLAVVHPWFTAAHHDLERRLGL